MYTRPAVSLPPQLAVAFLLDTGSICSRVRNVLTLADALVDRDHDVTIVTSDTPPPWRRSSAEWNVVDSFSAIATDRWDAIIDATTTGAALPRGHRVLRLFHPEQIDPVRLPDHTGAALLTLSPLLSSIARHAGREVFEAGCVVDDEFYERRTDTGERRRVLIAGSIHDEAKAIGDAWSAAAHARWYGAEFEIVRVSPWHPSSEEPVAETGAEVHVALDTPSLVRVIASCDIVLAAPLASLGYSQSTPEALAAGLAPVLTDVPAHHAWTADRDFALFAPEGDPESLGEMLVRALEEPRERLRLQRRAREVAESFRSERAGERLERILLDFRER